jgi:purine-binding chemotaxis protein CheW
MTRELITFEVSRQLFGLDIAAIREIRAWAPVTRLPGAPFYVAGMVNLRGGLLPVIDLGARLGWGMTRTTERHAIIVVQIGDVQTGVQAGLIVESVSDLVTLNEASLQQPPSLGVEHMTSFIDGLAPVGNRMLLVLNLDQLLDKPAVQA